MQGPFLTVFLHFKTKHISMGVPRMQDGYVFATSTLTIFDGVPSRYGPSQWRAAWQQVVNPPVSRWVWRGDVLGACSGAV